MVYSSSVKLDIIMYFIIKVYIIRYIIEVDIIMYFIIKMDISLSSASRVTDDSQTLTPTLLNVCHSATTYRRIHTTLSRVSITAHSLNTLLSLELLINLFTMTLVTP